MSRRIKIIFSAAGREPGQRVTMFEHEFDLEVLETLGAQAVSFPAHPPAPWQYSDRFVIEVQR